jgi:hypothetical protein
MELKAIQPSRMWIAVALTAAMVLLFGVGNPPLSWRWFPHCMLHSWTGLYCPGCGSARAFVAICHGDWLAALRLNPFTVVVVPVVGVLWATGRLERLRPVWIWTLLALVVAFGVLRNLPWYPWTLLAPQP